MTLYERGYAAALKAASEHCESRAGLRGIGAWAALTAVAEEILSLPIVGEADQMTARELAERIKRGEKWSVAPNPGERHFVQAVKQLNDGGSYDLTDSPKSYIATVQRLLAELAERNAAARPGPAQKCVMVPKIDLWEFMRSVLSQGASIYQDYIAGNHADYEQYSARLDIAARERAAMLTAREE